MKTFFAGVFFLTTLGMAVGLTPSQVSAASNERMGACANSNAEWKLKVKNEHRNLIELESEIDEATPGQHWMVKLSQNGTVFFNQKQRVNSVGNINVKRFRPNTSGLDRFMLHATGPAGQLCNGAISL